MAAIGDFYVVRAQGVSVFQNSSRHRRFDLARGHQIRACPTWFQVKLCNYLWPNLLLIK